MNFLTGTWCLGLIVLYLYSSESKASMAAALWRFSELKFFHVPPDFIWLEISKGINNILCHLLQKCFTVIILIRANLAGIWYSIGFSIRYISNIFCCGLKLGLLWMHSNPHELREIFMWIGAHPKKGLWVFSLLIERCNYTGRSRSEIQNVFTYFYISARVTMLS